MVQGAAVQGAAMQGVAVQDAGRKMQDAGRWAQGVVMRDVGRDAGRDAVRGAMVHDVEVRDEGCGVPYP